MKHLMAFFGLFAVVAVERGWLVAATGSGVTMFLVGIDVLIDEIRKPGEPR